ncbi:fusarin c cluster-cytochrome p450 [Ophiocordyceps camponoti-floridani]|uniref:Fusarin c cluster-cytochrome p450 n=1 Tax=Ophiocordyceps camponoti-floridani TaxID=2030778 RepID=A0A8H4QE09_9HYPO|nr:fusarin c cluster-cytochrome p450 [Ophiocordyceps camponoti-floridani]
MRLLRFPWAAQWLRYPSSFRLPEERLEDESKVVTVRHESLGVVVAICPWNFPIMLEDGLLGTSIVTSLIVSCVASVVIPKLISLLRNTVSPLRLIPGPLINKLSSWPLTMATLRGTSHHFTRNLHRRYGPIVVLAPGILSVADADEIRRVIRTQDWPKSEAIYGNFRQDPARPTLLAYTDKKAYGRRKRLMSAMFGIGNIRRMQSVMRQCVSVAELRLTRACAEAGAEPAVVDMLQLIHGLAVDIIGVTTFGRSLGVVETGSHPLPTRLKTGLKLAAWMQLMPWIRRLPLLPTRDPYIDGFTRDTVHGRRCRPRDPEATDLLQGLVDASSDDAGSEFRTSDVQDESVVLLTAGSETTANAELFTLVLLTRHPDVLRRLYAEVDAWYPPGSKRETDCGYSLAGMLLLQACIDEAMRLFPGQATGSPREASRDEKLLGFRVPRGTTVFPSTQEAHLDARAWHSPEAYDPDRWLVPVDGSCRPFWPFSGGSRVCIGKHFALQEMHLTLVGLLRRFYFERVPGQEERTVFRVAQQLAGGSYWMKVRMRWGYI